MRLQQLICYKLDKRHVKQTWFVLCKKKKSRDGKTVLNISFSPDPNLLEEDQPQMSEFHPLDCQGFLNGGFE